MMEPDIFKMLEGGGYIVECGCGGLDEPHRLGIAECYREFTNPPVLVQEGFSEWDERWEVAGSIITGYTLRYQRCYASHKGGIWSRPKGGGSINSLPDNT